MWSAVAFHPASTLETSWRLIVSSPLPFCFTVSEAVRVCKGEIPTIEHPPPPPEVELGLLKVILITLSAFTRMQPGVQSQAHHFNVASALNLRGYNGELRGLLQTSQRSGE